MWQSNKLFIVIGLLLAASASCRAAHVVVGDLTKYRTVDDVHGLFEINAEGQRFLRAYNRKHHTNWVGFGPDLRMQVERCLVPLRSRWAVQSDGQEGPGVMVLCDKSVQKRRWDILVNAYPPSRKR
ncbi:hypothetical protein [Massilia sp. TSP1-1-2]|uniref:hypothetical protein n=1 Tax=unclassified Massilia TaxID=2609279 RepID=UPI003CE98C80